MKLIYIKSTITMEPKNYSTIRSILKKAQGEKITPYVLRSMTPKHSRNIWIKKKSLMKFTKNEK